MLDTKAIKQKSPLIVELVGLAGAGKTTLSRALSQCGDPIRVAADLEVRKREHIPIFLRHVPSLLPLFLRRCRSSRWFTWDEIKAMVYLEAWPRVLRQQVSDNHTVILLDQGPVFKLATLDAFGPERLKGQGFNQWWHSMFEQWAYTLDIVIWLNAPDTILLERINTRTKEHLVKGRAEREAREFLVRYRMSYDQILTKLTARGGPTLLQFDTNQASVAQITAEARANFHLNSIGNGS